MLLYQSVVFLGCADADVYVATLDFHVQFGELASYLLVKVEDARVVQAELPDNIIGDIASADKVLQKSGGYPLVILHATLPVGKQLDEIGIEQLLGGIVLDDAPYGNPVDAGALNGNLRHMVFVENGEQFRQLPGQNTELSLKNHSFLIDNTRKKHYLCARQDRILVS